MCNMLKWCLWGTRQTLPFAFRTMVKGKFGKCFFKESVKETYIWFYEQKLVLELVVLPIKAGCLFVAGTMFHQFGHTIHQLGRKICHPCHPGKGDHLRKGILTDGCKNLVNQLLKV